MTIFDERDKGFENKFAHEGEIAFKVNARRNKLLGLWAAEKLGKKGEQAEAYAKEVIMADLDNHGVADKLLKDLSAIGITSGEVEKHMAELLPVAYKQIVGE